MVSYPWRSQMRPECTSGRSCHRARSCEGFGPGVVPDVLDLLNHPAIAVLKGTALLETYLLRRDADEDRQVIPCQEVPILARLWEQDDASTEKRLSYHAKIG